MKHKMIRVLGLSAIGMIFITLIMIHLNKPLANDIATYQYNDGNVKEQQLSNPMEAEMKKSYVKIKKDNKGFFRYHIEEDYMNQKLTLTIYSSNEKYYCNSRNIEGYHGTEVKSDLVKSSNFLYFYDTNQEVFATKVHMTLNSVYAYELKEDEENLYLILQKPKDAYEKVIVIDAGHGGTDGGAPSYDSITYEKDVNLNILLYLRDLMEGKEIKVYYTRVADDTVSLKRRVQLANVVEADLFISIHCNSSDSDEPSGTEILYHGNTQEEGYGSMELAQYCLEEIVNALGLYNRGLVESSNEIYIVRKSEVPIALVEVGFLSNEKDFFTINILENQNKVAKAIYDAIQRFYSMDKKGT